MRNLAVSRHRLAGSTNISAACRHTSRHLIRATDLPIRPDQLCRGRWEHRGPHVHHHPRPAQPCLPWQAVTSEQSPEARQTEGDRAGVGDRLVDRLDGVVAKLFDGSDGQGGIDPAFDLDA